MNTPSMKILGGLLCVASFSLALATAQDPPAPTSPNTQPEATADAHAQAWLKILLSHMGSPDPRVRLSVREGLRMMGTRSIRAVKQARAGEQNADVKAFMKRTTTWLQIKLGKTSGKGGRAFWDIDHVAAHANLRWEQMKQVLPILVRSLKERQAVRAAFREVGGDPKDPEAMRDLREEIVALAAVTEKELAKVLTQKQLARVRGYYDPRAYEKKQRAKEKR